MTNKNKKLKIIIPVLCLLVIAGVLCGVFVPRLLMKETRQVNYVQGDHESVSFGSSFKPYVNAGNAILYVDEESGAVAIADKENKVVFNSHSKSAANGKLASVIAVTFRDKVGNSYVKSSTDNSVEHGGLKIESEKKNSVTLTFNFIVDRIGTVEEIIKVKFSEQNGGIKAEVDLGEVTLKEGYCIEKISILPGLFSENNPGKQCFYTVPDGCGAQVDLTTKPQKAFSQTLDVYGSDVAFKQYSKGASLPCFAMTKGNAMLTVVMDDGDALSSIYVKHNKSKGGSLYNTFTVTPYGKSNGRLIKGTSYNGVISQVYYLTTDGVNNYNTVASIVRDTLTDKGYLATQMSETFVDYPFFITAIGTANGKKNTVYTTFENGAEMIALLKSRGVRCIALRFAGAGNKGLNSGAGSAVSLSSAIGGKSGYNNLCSIAQEKNSSVWYDTNLSLNVSKNGNAGVYLYDDLKAYLSITPVKSRLSSYRSVYAGISDAYKFLEQTASGNICVNDMSYALYTDIYGKVDRQAALDSLKDKIQSLGVSNGLMLSNPAVYLMNQADAVFSVPQSSVLEQYEGVASVPLLQMVIHGSVCYGSEPVNLFEDSTDAVLKAVEFGASPSFVFTYDNSNILDYGVYATQTSKFYSSVKRMLPLMDMKITSHEQVVSGVYKITYDYSKVVYVNYNPSVVEVNGILVSAKDFVVI